MQSSVCPYRVHAAARTSPIRFAIHRAVRLVRHMFPQNFPFLFEDRHPTYSVSHCSSGQAHSSSQTASRSVQPFLYGFQMLCLTMHCQWGRKPPNCPYPLGFRHVARGGPSHSHMQHPQKIGRDRSCGIGSILADIYKILQSLDVLAYSLNTSQPK